VIAMRAITMTFPALVLAGACAAGAGFLPPENGAQSAYGAFLAARYAGTSRELDESARLYSHALSFDPGLAFLSQRAFYAALLAGDFTRADEVSDQAAQGEDPTQLSNLYVKAARLAGTLLSEPAHAPEYGPFATMIAQMLDQWSLAASRRDGAARAVAEGLETPFNATSYVLVHRALLHEAAGDHDAAERAYRSADMSLDLQGFAAILLGEFLERRGRRNEAREVYERNIARASGAPDPEVEAALERVIQRGRAPRFPGPAQAAARALFAPSALLNEQAPVDYSALYLRLIQRLDPHFSRNTLALAEVLNGLNLLEASHETFNAVRSGPFAEHAAVQAVWIDYRLGNHEAAISRAQSLAQTARAEEPRLLLADLLRMSERCEEAERLYFGVIEDRHAAGREPDWRHVFFAALCRQTTQGWLAARPLYENALEIEPEEPRLLNHLGYNLIVLNEDLERGFEMVLRAAELAPDNGAVLDSVGWGYFKQGDYEEAVRWLERAAERAPSNPTINWHLGDAYAAVGRQMEARFQWRRALELEPPAREQTLIERRLELGLAAGPADPE